MLSSFGSRKRAHGFTLIEILVVMAIIGILVAIVATRMVFGSANAKRQATRIKVSDVVASVQQYSFDVGHAPERLDDLIRRPSGATNWNGPYVDDRQLLDAWGRKLVYRNPGEHREFDVLSYGADGHPGGEGPQAEDVVSW